MLHGETVTPNDWPDGSYRATWFNPQNGREVATTVATSADGWLTLPLPDFSEDLASIVTPPAP